MYTVNRQITPSFLGSSNLQNRRKSFSDTLLRGKDPHLVHNESFAFNGTLRCAYDALRFVFTRIATKKSVRRNEVARLYGVSGSLTERLSRTEKPIYALR